MQSHLVVVLLDEFLQVLLQFLHGAVGSGVDFFLLQCFHKALAPTVLPRPPGPAHPETPPDPLQPFHIIIAGVGGSSVGMVHHSRRWLTTLNGLVQSRQGRSEEHTSELQSPCNLVCRLLLEKKKKSKQ